MINPVENLGEESVTRILQKKELSMLKEVKEILEKNNIQFYLACGTALGCVRHKGFIPWDDDIDIYIMGKDYGKIKNAINNDISSNLIFQDYTTVNNYPYWFPKIVAKDTVLVEKSFGNMDYACGVYIDVFPLFSASDNRFVREMQELCRYLWYAMIRSYYNESFSKGIKKFIKTISKLLVKPKRIQKRLEKIYCKTQNDGRFLIDSGVFNKQALLKKESFEKIVDLKFEDTTMPMPYGYDTYLNDYYGDYMVMPPEKDRVSRHHIAKLEIKGVEQLVE